MDGEISPGEVADLLAGDAPPRIVDVSTPEEFRAGHIPGSVNVPIDDIPARVRTFADADRIVAVCPRGEASVQAARLIESFEGTGDARVESMAGGLREWPGELVASEGADDDGSATDREDAASDRTDAPR